MTGRAPKTCSWRDGAQGCSRRAEEAPNGDDFRCRAHWRTSTLNANQRDRQRRIKRLTEGEKDYIRERDFGVCRECGAPAREVDHIAEIADGGDNAPSNLQLLCDRHHAAKTRISQENWRPGRRADTSARAQAKRRARAAGTYVQ